MNKKPNKQSKKTVILFWAIFGLIIMGGLGLAVTTISDTEISSGGDINIPKDAKLIIVSDNTGQTGESAIDFYASRGESKAYLQWYDNFTTPGSPSIMGWFGCHYNLSNGNVHQHCGLESNDSDIGFAETKIDISWGTTRATAWARVSNVAEFILGSNMNHLRIRSADILYEGEIFDIQTANQTTFGLRIKNNTDSVVLQGKGSDDLYIDSDIIITDNEVIINSTQSTQYFINDRLDTGDEAGLRLKTGGTTRWSIGMRADEGENLFIRTGGSINALKINQTPQAEVTFFNLTGSGNALVCVRPDGTLYRGNTTGCP